MPKAYSYLRFSTPEQAQGDSFRRQTEAARRYAEYNALQLDDRLSFADRGVSAYRGLNAETGALGLFLEAVDAGDVPAGSFLLVESLDRISRQTVRRAVRTLESIVDRGVSVVDLSDSNRVYSANVLDADPMAFFMMAVRFMRAHEESAMKSARLKAAWSNKRANAGSRPLTSRAPAWLQLESGRTWHVHQDRAAVVRRIFAMAAEGRGEHAIAVALNEDGVAPFGNGIRLAAHWHRTSVAKILRNPAVIGILQPYTEDHVDGRKRRTAQTPVEGHFPVIVDSETWSAVRALKIDARSPQRGRHATGTIHNVLGGLASCPMCGSTMTRLSKGSNAKAGRPYLVCTKAKAGAGCRYKAVPVEDVEQALLTNREWLTETGPAGATSIDLERQLAENASAQERQRDTISRLVEAIASGMASPAILEALAEAEQILGQLRAFERDITTRADVADSAITERRLASLRRLLEVNPVDRAAVNVALRQMLSHAVVDYRCGLLVLRWKGNYESQIRFSKPENVDDTPAKWRKAAAFFARMRGDQPTPKANSRPNLE